MAADARASAVRPAPGQRARAALFWLVFAANTIVIGIVAGVVGWLLPSRRAYRFGYWWCWLNLHAARWIGGLAWRVQGREAIPERAVVFLSKHQSIWETMALVVLLPEHVHVLKRELLRVPFFGWGLAALRPIAIDRSAGRDAVDQLRLQGRAQLAAGRSVMVFPEGTRVRPGATARYRPGGAILAAETATPMVPIAHNAGELWSRDTWVPRAGVVDVIVGAPIDPAGRSPEVLNEAVSTWIEARMGELPGAGAARSP
ncbi:MAG: 1-acyl-sn-glycerol-3-phosphate acyltransferase [Proteobacteria bacterium SW_6_67_9]|nr:MAG: 1-acyl-sn-glycerol-3-phosphate acyltransferase [Proteobacteria bacterium SW_6_67_9]